MLNIKSTENTQAVTIFISLTEFSLFPAWYFNVVFPTASSKIFKETDMLAQCCPFTWRINMAIQFQVSWLLSMKQLPAQQRENIHAQEKEETKTEQVSIYNINLLSCSHIGNHISAFFLALCTVYVGSHKHQSALLIIAAI